jgi:hypothetical protein
MAGRTNYPGVKQDGGDQPERQALVINQLLLGKTNNTIDVTLTAGATTTTVDDTRIYETSALVFCPKTANAAAHPMTYFTVTNGVATLHHDNDASVDRTGVLIIVA